VETVRVRGILKCGCVVLVCWCVGVVGVVIVVVVVWRDKVWWVGGWGLQFSRSTLSKRCTCSCSRWHLQLAVRTLDNKVCLMILDLEIARLLWFDRTTLLPPVSQFVV
jgi:hypothetical protein